MNIPSYKLKVDDVLSMKAKSAKIPIVIEAMKEEKQQPNWLEVKGKNAKMLSIPVREDATEKVEEQLIVEYYSK